MPHDQQQKNPSNDKPGREHQKDAPKKGGQDVQKGQPEQQKMDEPRRHEQGR